MQNDAANFGTSEHLAGQAACNGMSNLCLILGADSINKIESGITYIVSPILAVGMRKAMMPRRRLTGETSVVDVSVSIDGICDTHTAVSDFRCCAVHRFRAFTPLYT